MGDRLRRRVNRAKYAAIRAAVGAALGNLMSREVASAAAGIGAVAGANLGESRAIVTYEGLKRKKSGGTRSRPESDGGLNRTDRAGRGVEAIDSAVCGRASSEVSMPAAP